MTASAERKTFNTVEDVIKKGREFDDIVEDFVLSSDDED